MPSNKSIPDLESRIAHAEGEIKALEVASKFIAGRIKYGNYNLQKMKTSLVRLKASTKTNEIRGEYAKVVKELKRKSKETKLQEELNEMELKGMI